jgi:plasmid stabilization system protein ParE
MNEPLGFARIDREDFGEQELLARIGPDPSPSAASEERRTFRDDLERLLRQPGAGQVQLLPGLAHAVRWLREAGVRTRVLVVLADLGGDAAAIDAAADLDLEGIDVVAWRSPVRASRSEAGTPPGTRRIWQQRNESTGGRLHLLDGVAGLTSWLES